MTDRPMDANATEHPEEGLIHAWLDDALGAPEAARLAAHVQACAECQARVAEARGLIAGASRIVAALDDAPAGARPGWAQAARVESGAAGVPSAAASAAAVLPQRSLWRWLRLTPGRAALAATLLVAVAITMTYDRVAEESVRSAKSVINPQQMDVPASTPAEGGGAEGAKEARPRDELLDSAVARSVAATQGRAKMEAASGPSIPQAPPPSTSAELPTGASAERVALGRAVAEAQRETSSVAADRLRVGNAGEGAAGAAAGAVEPTAARSQRRIPAAPPVREDAIVLQKSVDAGARSCVRIDSPDPDARWGDQPFPLVLAVDPGAVEGPRSVSVLTVAGQPTELRATWRAREGDSVAVALRRIGYSGSIVLGPNGGTRSGVAVSAAAPVAIQGDVAAAPMAQSRARAEGARDEARRSAAAPQPAPAPGPPLRELRVTARTVPCPQ